MTMVNIVKKI